MNNDNILNSIQLDDTSFLLYDSFKYVLINKKWETRIIMYLDHKITNKKILKYIANKIFFQ